MVGYNEQLEPAEGKLWRDARGVFKQGKDLWDHSTDPAQFQDVTKGCSLALLLVGIYILEIGKRALRSWTLTLP